MSWYQGCEFKPHIWLYTQCGALKKKEREKKKEKKKRKRKKEWRWSESDHISKKEPWIITDKLVVWKERTQGWFLCFWPEQLNERWSEKGEGAGRSGQWSFSSDISCLACKISRDREFNGTNRFVERETGVHSLSYVIPFIRTTKDCHICLLHVHLLLDIYLGERNTTNCQGNKLGSVSLIQIPFLPP